MTHELAVLCLIGALFGALVLAALLAVARRREVQRALTASAPPGAWTTPVVLALEDPAGFDAAGVLILDGATAVLHFRWLRGLGSFTRDGSPFERIELDASTKLTRLEKLGGATGLRLALGERAVWLAVDQGGAFVSSDQLALELVPRLEQALGLEPRLRGSDAPLLRLGSLGRTEAWNATRAVLPGVVVCVAFALLVWREWLAQSGGGLFGVVPPRSLMLALLVPGGWALHRLLVVSRATACSVALFEDRLVFTRERTTTVRWETVGGYRDDSEGFVRLVLRPGVSSDGTDLTLPTRTEAERTAVLAFLDERGLKRDE